MGTLIGPINKTDWQTMSLLRGSLEYMKAKDRNRYQTSIEKETNLYKKYKEKYLTAA